MTGSPLSGHVLLTGFMGSGKTTVGAALARAAGAPFDDLDEEVESQLNLSIVDIFQAHGEPFFRRAELDALRGLTAASPRVVALGSGTFCSPEGQDAANRAGLTVWLECPFAEMMQRYRHFHAPRPFAGGEAELRALLEQRLPFYAGAALHLPTGARPVAAVVEELLRALRWKNLLPPEA